MYPSPLMILEDISLLSFELASDIPGEEGPLDMKLGGPLHPTPTSKFM